MTRYRHVRATYGADLDISADSFFDAASDWTGLLNYLGEPCPFKFTHISVAEGSQIGKLPLTRRMHLDKSLLPPDTPPDAVPDYFPETLLAADRDAGTIVYRVEGNALGMRNYYAVKEVESLAPHRCHASISSRFDYPADEDVDSLLAALELVYRGVIHGIANTLGSKAQSRL